MGTSTTDGNQGAFSVTAQRLRRGYIFAHELGHNLGAHHDPGTDTNDRVSLRPRLLQQPGKLANDHVLQLPADAVGHACRTSPTRTSATGEPGRATRQKRNNARVLNETAFHVANFRKALPPAHSIPLVMSADDHGSAGIPAHHQPLPVEPGTVRIDAFDDRGPPLRPREPVDRGAGRRGTSTPWISRTGERREGTLPEASGTAAATGGWCSTTTLDVKTRAYVRTSDGFLTSIHEVAAEEDAGSMRYRVPTFNPGKNKEPAKPLAPDQRRRRRGQDRGLRCGRQRAIRRPKGTGQSHAAVPGSGTHVDRRGARTGGHPRCRRPVRDGKRASGGSPSPPTAPSRS